MDGDEERQAGNENVTWEENNCVERNTSITIDKQAYFLAADGNLPPGNTSRRQICDISISRESMRSRPQAATRRLAGSRSNRRVVFASIKPCGASCRRRVSPLQAHASRARTSQVRRHPKR
jgi:hypothetical protein